MNMVILSVSSFIKLASLSSQISSNDSVGRQSALYHIDELLTDENASARSRFRSGIKSLREVEEVSAAKLDHASEISHLVNLYLRLVHLLPQVAHFGLDMNHRLRELDGLDRVLYTGAIHAIHSGQTRDAVQLLEEGRAVFWSQALRLRGSNLEASTDKVTAELSRVLRTLDQGSHNADSIRNRVELEKVVEQRRKLNTRALELIGDIRKCPGFERFMMVPGYNELSVAASQGPVVLLVASERGCPAIIIPGVDRPAEHLPLALVRLQELGTLKVQAQRTGMRDSRPENDISRAMRQSQASRLSEATVLKDIWVKIVKPILQSLGLTKSLGKARPRLHWCPTGDFASLPLHAAGDFIGTELDNVSNYVVLSYTPTLQALINARSGKVTIERRSMMALVAAEPGAAGLNQLREVQNEAERVSDLVKSAHATVINDIVARPTVQTITAGIPKAHMLHLACHGQQREDPLASHFVLSDGPLTISALMKLNLTDAMFAFLSACETAKGDQYQRGQCVHLASSMLFCGFKSVIATMWSMNDADGPDVARHVYEQLLSQETINLNDVPYALDDAVDHLRRNGISPSRWATFIHVGG